MAGLFQTANELAIKAASNEAEWVAYLTSDATLLTTRPSTAADGLATTDALYTEVVLSTRANPAYRSVFITVATNDNAATTTITVTVAGVAHATAGGPWASATLAAAAVAATLEAVAGIAASSDGAVITIIGDTAADFSLGAITVNAGTTTFTVAGDAAAGIFALWVLPTSTVATPVPWAYAGDSYDAITVTGTALRLESAVPTRSCARIAVQASTLTGVAGDAAAAGGAITSVGVVPLGYAWLGPSYAVPSTP